MKTKYVAIFDLEGTLTDNNHRLTYARQQEWDEYNARFRFDPVKLEVLSTWKTLQEDPLWALVISTGKEDTEQGREDVDRFLAYYGMLPDLMKYRKKGDRRGSELVKADHLFDIKKLYPNHTIALAVDDRMKNVEMFRSRGVPTVYIPGSDH